MSLPPPTHELKSSAGVVLSGSSVTSWGDAAGGTSPTFSDDEADKILNYPVIQFVGSSSQYLVWNAIAAMFSGDDPDFTAAVLFKPKSAAGAKTLLAAGNASDGRNEVLRITGTPTLISNRRDNTLSENAINIAGAGQIAYGTMYLAIVRQSGSTQSGLLHRISDGLEVSGTGTVDVAATTMTSGAIGADPSSGVVDQFATADYARIWLKDSALTGDLVADATTLQIAELKAEMLTPLGGGSTTLQHGKLSGIIGQPLRGLL